MPSPISSISGGSAFTDSISNALGTADVRNSSFNNFGNALNTSDMRDPSFHNITPAMMDVGGSQSPQYKADLAKLNDALKGYGVSSGSPAASGSPATSGTPGGSKPGCDSSGDAASGQDGKDSIKKVLEMLTQLLSQMMQMLKGGLGQQGASADSEAGGDATSAADSVEA